jgi:hypothetical protein
MVKQDSVEYLRQMAVQVLRDIATDVFACLQVRLDALNRCMTAHFI